MLHDTQAAGPAVKQAGPRTARLSVRFSPDCKNGVSSLYVIFCGKRVKLPKQALNKAGGATTGGLRDRASVVLGIKIVVRNRFLVEVPQTERLSLEGIPQKRCSQCGKVRPNTKGYFVVDTRNSSGLGASCRFCVRDRVRKYLKDHVKKYSLETRRRNRERSKVYRATNKDAIRTSSLKRFQKDPARSLLAAAKRRACNKRLKFTLKLKHVRGLVGELCPVLGFAYSFQRGRGCNITSVDSSPSIDRLDPKLGYTPDNIAVISNRANRLKSDGLAEEHEALAFRMRALNSFEPTKILPEADGRRIMNQLRGRLNVKAKKGCLIELTLTLGDLPEVPEVCPYFGIFLQRSELRPGDSSYSLDRIDPSKGYVRGNVEFISNRANRLKSDGTADEHSKIAAWMRARVALKREVG